MYNTHGMLFWDYIAARVLANNNQLPQNLGISEYFFGTA